MPLANWSKENINTLEWLAKYQICHKVWVDLLIIINIFKKVFSIKAKEKENLELFYKIHTKLFFFKITRSKNNGFII